jgi:quercetin dioxygenase-like cupin family protein
MVMGKSGDGARQASATRQVDDERVRITRYDFAPGDETGWHRHELPYAIVPLVDGVLRLLDRQGERLAELKAGGSYSRPAGIEHNVINAGSGPMAFVEVEIKL